MRKLFLIAAFAVFGVSAINAQEFKIGVNAALPIGDAGDAYTFGAAVDFAYLFEVADMVWVGPQVSYFHYFGDSIDVLGTSFDIDDAQFVPIAATGRIGFGDSFYAGADLGYALGVSDGNDGGFYYRPKIGYNFGSIGIILSYSGISVSGGTFSSVNGGVEFGF